MNNDKITKLRKEYDTFLKLKTLNSEYENEINENKKQQLLLEILNLSKIISYYDYDFYGFDENKFFNYQAYEHSEDKLENNNDNIYYLYAAYRFATKEEKEKFSHLIMSIYDEGLMPTNLEDENALFCEYWNIESVDDKKRIPIGKCDLFEKNNKVIYRTTLKTNKNQQLFFNDDYDEEEYWSLSTKYYEYNVKNDSQNDIIKKLLK